MFSDCPFLLEDVGIRLVVALTLIAVMVGVYCVV